MESKRKGSTSTMRGLGLSGDTGYGSGGSQPGYMSGGDSTCSQPGSQGAGYAASYEDSASDYSGLQEDEFSLIFQERLSNSSDFGGSGSGWGMKAGPGQGNAHLLPQHHQPHHRQQQMGYQFQMPPQQSPSQRYVTAPPSLIPASSSSASSTTTSHQMLPGEMTAPNNAHHSGGGMDFMSSRRNNCTPSSGYLSYRSSEKSPPSAADDIDGASVVSSGLRSNPMTTSLSTFSSNSSRVSSPSAGSDNRSLFHNHHHHHHHHSSMLGGGARGGVASGADGAGRSSGGFPQKHSLRNSYHPQQQQQQQRNQSNPSPPSHPHQQHSRRHSDEVSNSSRGWTYSSQSSRYSSELSDDLLDNLPSDVRRNSFSKSNPLPLPESMQQNFSMEFSGDAGMGGAFSQQQNGFVDHSTLPLRHFDNSDVLSGGSQHLHEPMFSQDGPARLSGEAYVNMMQHHLSSPSNSLVSPGNNMVLGTMDTFSQALSEETQYYENLYHNQVHSQVK